MTETAAMKWNGGRLLLLGGCVCIVNLVFSIAGSHTTPRIIITVPPLDLRISSAMALILLASFAPGAALLAGSKECRAAALRFRASARTYLTAVLVGFALPFSGYLGDRSMYPLPNSSTVPTLVKVFLINILLTPLWEEIIWRGYFYAKVDSLLRRSSAIVVSSLGWTVWHAGLLYYLHHSGVRIAVLAIFVPQIFFVGTILCSLFTLGRNSLFPCVLFHTAFNASIWTYTASGHAVNDIGSRISGTLFTLVVAIVAFRMALRRTGNGPERGNADPAPA